MFYNELSARSPRQGMAIPEVVSWVFHAYDEEDEFDATYSGTANLVSATETVKQWSVPDPGSAPIPFQVVVTKLAPDSYSVQINAGSGFDGEEVLMAAPPTGVVTTHATGNSGESTLSHISVNFGGL